MKKNTVSVPIRYGDDTIFGGFIKNGITVVLNIILTKQSSRQQVAK